MINIIICDNNEIFSNTLSKMVAWFFKNEGLNTNIIFIKEYDKKFEETLTLNNQIYILGFEDEKNSYESITKKIKNMDRAIPILILNNKCKQSFFNFLSGTTHLKNIYRKSDSTNKVKFKDKNTYYSLNINKILYITTNPNKRQTIIQYENTQYQISKSLTEVISMLNDDFIQTHRSCYINKKRLEYMDLTNNIIKFDNNTFIENLSRKFKRKI